MGKMTKDEVNVSLFDECKRLQAKVDELTGLNNLLLKEHVMGGKISRHTSNKTWKNWVEACREVDVALYSLQEGE